MFNPPTHSETWFRNTRYWVFSFRASFGLLYRQYHCWLHCPAVSTNLASTENFALHHWTLCADLKLSFAVAATDKTCDPGRWTVLCGIYSFFCLEDFDFNTILHKASTRCLILLPILKPDFETPHTEFSHLVPGLDFFIGSVTVGSTVWQFQPILLPPRILLFIIELFVQIWSCLLLWLQPIKHAILIVGLLCEIHIFAWSFRIGYEFHCRHGFNMMFDSPTHSGTWFRNTTYWVFSFRSSFGFLHRQCHCWLHCPAVSTNRVSTENFALHHWILYSELKLSFAVAATDKTCDPGRWTVLCEIHIFTWSIGIVYGFRCRHGFNLMFNPPTHSETWFRNTTYWVFSFSS